MKQLVCRHETLKMCRSGLGAKLKKYLSNSALVPTFGIAANVAKRGTEIRLFTAEMCRKSLGTKWHTLVATVGIAGKKHSVVRTTKTLKQKHLQPSAPPGGLLWNS